MRIEVRGDPAPQGSKRGIIHRSTGRVVMMESSKKVKPWRESVRAAALEERDLAREGATMDIGGYDEPLVVRMIFSFVRPKGHYRTGRNAHLLRDDAPRQPCGIPDLSKLLRSTEDALTQARVWRDDARVSTYERAAKVWCGEDPEALDTPGAVIVIRRLTDPEPF